MHIRTPVGACSEGSLGYQHMVKYISGAELEMAWKLTVVDHQSIVYVHFHENGMHDVPKDNHSDL